MRERERFRPPTEGWGRCTIGNYIIEYQHHDDYEGGLSEWDEEHIEKLLEEGYSEGELVTLEPRSDETHRGWWRKLSRVRGNPRREEESRFAVNSPTVRKIGKELGFELRGFEPYWLIIAIGDIPLLRTSIQRGAERTTEIPDWFMGRLAKALGYDWVD